MASVSKQCQCLSAEMSLHLNNAHFRVLSHWVHFFLLLLLLLKMLSNPNLGECVFGPFCRRHIYPDLHIKRNPNTKWNKEVTYCIFMSYLCASLAWRVWDAFKMTASQREVSSFPPISMGDMEVFMSSIVTPASWWEDKKLLGIINKCNSEAVLLQREAGSVTKLLCDWEITALFHPS